MVKLRVKEPLRNERGEVVGSSNYGIYSAGEVFVLSDEEAQRELTVCGHAIERYAEWEDRQRTERSKQVYTRQQAEDFARHQAELKQLSLAEVELRKQAASKHLNLSESESYSFTFDPEKEELRRKLEEKEKLLAELTAKKGPGRKEKRATLPSMQKNTHLKEILDEEFLPDEEV